MKKMVFILLFTLLNITSSIKSFQEAFNSRSHPKWYPSSPTQLKSQLSQNERDASSSYDFHCDSNKIRAIIMPHASLAASGDVAAAGPRLLSKTHYKKIIIIGLMHGNYGTKTNFVLLPTNLKKYSTPLGAIDLESSSAKELQRKDSSLFSFRRAVSAVIMKSAAFAKSLEELAMRSI